MNFRLFQNHSFQKGVKRKADAMAGSPAGVLSPNSTYDSSFPGGPQNKMGKISTRRESGRQIKKVNKDLPDSQVESQQVVVSSIVLVEEC